MSHHQQLIADEIASVQAQKTYCQSALAVEGLEPWERKEYSALVEQYDQKLIELNARLELTG
jgi:hypothetical protein